MKRFITILMALVMLLSLATTAFAAENGTITITTPSGLDAAASNSYKIYKVFDAVGDGVNISYKLVSGKTTAPDGFAVDTAGNVTYSGTEGATNLTAADIAAIAAYVTEADLVDTVTITGSGTGVSAPLPNGYYYITTSTGSVVTINSTNPSVNVNDKNVAPTLDKKITNANSVKADGKYALAEVGSTVEFEATFKVEVGAQNYEFHDRMDAGLSYNSDVAVFVDNNLIDASNYTNESVNGETITIMFNNDWIKDMIGKTVVVKYSATVTSDALFSDPAKNTAWLEYGDENSNNKTPDSITEVYNAKFEVVKKDDKEKPLAGAGFVLKNSEGKYYKLDNNYVTWVENISDATEYTSDDNGQVTAFTGLANGTYTLVEKTVPAGYNKADDYDFTVKDASAANAFDADNLRQSTVVTNKAGATLPSTGGMGTTLFYVFGGIMMLAAVVLLVTKKRMANAE